MAAESLVALEPITVAAAVQERLLVEFELDGECYGVDIADIREIIRYQPVTVIPGAPAIVEGIINLRGRVTPIVDLRRRLGLHRTEANESMRIIVIEVDDALVGVHVDAVTGVVSLSGEQVQALSSDVTTDRSDYLEGVADVDGRLVVLINLQNALEDGVGPIAAPSMNEPADEVAPAAEAPIEAPAALEEPDPVDEAAPVTSQPSDDSSVVEPVAAEPADEASMDLGLRIDLLTQSFEVLAPRAEDFVARFSESLFEQNPEVQSLFPDGADGEVWSVIEGAVASLPQSDVLIAYLEDRARQYVTHGAEAGHYEVVGTVLVETLGAVAGDLWTDEVRDAWSDAASLAAVVMLDAAASADPLAAAGSGEPADPPSGPATDLDATGADPAPVAKPTPKRARAKTSAAKKPAAKKTARGNSAKQTAAKKPRSKKSTAASVAAKKPAAKKRTTKAAAAS